jgi:hypothetical protein
MVKRRISSLNFPAAEMRRRTAEQSSPQPQYGVAHDKLSNQNGEIENRFSVGSAATLQFLGLPTYKNSAMDFRTL